MRFCLLVGMFSRISSALPSSNSAYTKAGSWPVVAKTSPQGPTMVEWPHAW